MLSLGVPPNLGTSSSHRDVILFFVAACFFLFSRPVGGPELSKGKLDSNASKRSPNMSELSLDNGTMALLLWLGNFVEEVGKKVKEMKCESHLTNI
jgi:hypothetical protein